MKKNQFKENPLIFQFIELVCSHCCYSKAGTSHPSWCQIYTGIEDCKLNSWWCSTWDWDILTSWRPSMSQALQSKWIRPFPAIAMKMDWKNATLCIKKKFKNKFSQLEDFLSFWCIGPILSCTLHRLVRNSGYKKKRWNPTISLALTYFRIQIVHFISIPFRQLCRALKL